MVATLIVAGPTVVLLRRVARTPRGGSLDIEAEVDVRPDLSVERPVEHRCVADRFSEVVRSRAEHVALRTENSSVTYGELGRTAAAWTAALRNRAAPDSPLALIGGLDADTAAVILGSFAAGAPLVPLDTGLPHDRVQHIFDALAEQGYHLGLVVVDDRPHPLVDALAGRQVVWTADRPHDPFATCGLPPSRATAHPRPPWTDSPTPTSSCAHRRSSSRWPTPRTETRSLESGGSSPPESRCTATSSGGDGNWRRMRC